jgi:hypothetical protein
MTSYVSARRMRQIIFISALASLPAFGVACSEGTKWGACIVTKYPINGVSYHEDHDYCMSQSQCDSYCAGAKSLTNIGGCKWDPHGLCEEQPETLTAPKVCAVSQSIVCGGGGDDFKTICDPNCTYDPGSSDYDPSTDCLTQYRSQVGHGASCDEAIADLDGTKSPAPSGAGGSSGGTTGGGGATSGGTSSGGAAGAGQGGSSSSCAASASDTACNTCGKRYCCAETNACAASADCLSLAKCVTACTTQTCSDACGAQYPGAVAPFNAFVTCGNDHCLSDCGG